MINAARPTIERRGFIVLERFFPSPAPKTTELPSNSEDPRGESDSRKRDCQSRFCSRIACLITMGHLRGTQFNVSRHPNHYSIPTSWVFEQFADANYSRLLLPPANKAEKNIIIIRCSIIWSVDACVRDHLSVRNALSRKSRVR